MKRMFYVDATFGMGTEKYRLRKEYEGFGIYDEMTPSGYLKSQSYLITNGDVIVLIQSYNNLCYDEVLDMIDHYNEMGEFGKKMLRKKDETNNKTIYVVHPSGVMN